MTIQRIFLGWERPALLAAVDWLIEQFGTADSLDLSGLIVAVPGGRAGRRLLEVLVDRAESSDRGWRPPTIVTVGHLPELLYEPQRPFAGPLVQQFAWIEALRRLDPARLKRIVPVAPADDDLFAWLELGDMLAKLHVELAAEALDFEAVAACGSGLEGFLEGPRWEALADLQKGYLEVVDRLGLWDRQTARLVAVRQAECKAQRSIVLLGTVDLNRTQRRMLDQVAEKVTALVHAPEGLADRFDEHGCVKADAWQEVPIGLQDEQIEVVDGPGDQATAAVRALASLDGRYAAEEITIGVPDERLVPHVSQRLAGCGVAARHGPGMPIRQSAPYCLLAAAADHLEARRFSTLASLVRHPDVEAWLAAHEVLGYWITQMDRYQSEHLPYRHGTEWLGGMSHHERLRQVSEAVDNLLSGLTGPARPLEQWGTPIVGLLAEVLGGDSLDPSRRSDRVVLVACEKIHASLRDQAAVPHSMMPAVSGAEAIRLVLSGVGSERIAPVPDKNAVELLGWLELPLDDAPTLIVTGFNEGLVPGSLNADLFLPNQLRRALGIEDNDRRYARDAYALSVLAASREELRLIVGRRTTEADPLSPSRLLFACGAEATARRARLFFASGAPVSTEAELAGVLRPGERSAFEVPRPEPLAEAVASMRVTEFKDYLACPYRYYLRHRLKLAGLDDRAEELDSAQFGLAIHAVLGLFGQSDLAGSTRADEIGRFLDEALDRLVRAQYGKAPLPAIRVQAEQIRRRLAAFAQWQAGWAAQGWRIEHAEEAPEEGQAVLVVDREPMVLRGRIDRIDVNEQEGRRIVIDYKSFDRPRPPDQTHRTRGEWTDLQLPLYRHLAAALAIEGPVELGYIVLPKDVDKVDCLVAEWTEEELAQADRVACEVVRSVRAERFWPPASPPPAFSEEFSGICQDGQFAVASTLAEAEGDAAGVSEGNAFG